MYALPPQFTATIAAQRRAHLELEARRHDLGRVARAADPCARRTHRDTLRLFVERIVPEVTREPVPHRAAGR